MPNVQFAPFYVAIEKGFYEQRGLKVSLNHHPAGADVFGGLVAGQENVMMAGGDEVLAARAKGAELVYVAEVFTRYPIGLIVPADSGVQSVADLKGKKVAGADPLSTSGNLYPRAFLVSQGIDPNKDVQWVYSGGHDKSIIALVNGQVDAAVVFGEYKGTPDARDRVKGTIPDVMQKTRVLLNSESVNAMIPNDTVSARKDLAADLKTKIRDGLLAVAKTEDGIKELQALYQINGLDVGNPADYAPILEAAKAANIDLGAAIAPPPTRAPATAAPAGAGTPAATAKP